MPVPLVITSLSVWLCDMAAIVPVPGNVRMLNVQLWLCETGQELFVLNMKRFNFQSSEIFKLEILPTLRDVKMDTLFKKKERNDMCLFFNS